MTDRNRRSAARRAVRPLAALALVAGAAGCASIPNGPSTMALPGSTRTFAQFRIDDDACRRYALERIGGQGAERVAQDTVAAGAVGGAAVGAVAGAAIGGSRGAGVGAGTGLLVGTAVGSDRSSTSGWDAQRRYDQSYVQCMYAAGHKVPVAEGSFRGERAPLPRAATPGLPMPPAGAPPAPPP
ncbi:MAG TPA: YMGG-like glycine zipper-containing protein, partial [Burkholderiaceae bacterium]|nr:YMGG-like glycine zipper-containing protein [Burkholderiaceae bacterium]